MDALAPKTRWGKRTESAIKYAVPVVSLLVAALALLTSYFNLLTIKSVNYRSQQLQQASVQLQGFSLSEQQLSLDRTLQTRSQQVGLGAVTFNFENESTKPIYLTSVSTFMAQNGMDYDAQRSIDDQMDANCKLSIWTAAGTTVNKQPASCQESIAIPPDSLMIVSTSYKGDPVEKFCNDTHTLSVQVAVNIETIPGQSDSQTTADTPCSSDPLSTLRILPNASASSGSQYSATIALCLFGTFLLLGAGTSFYVFPRWRSLRLTTTDGRIGVGLVSGGVIGVSLLVLGLGLL